LITQILINSAKIQIIGLKFRDQKNNSVT